MVVDMVVEGHTEGHSVEEEALVSGVARISEEMVEQVWRESLAQAVEVAMEVNEADFNPVFHNYLFILI